MTDRSLILAQPRRRGKEEINVMAVPQRNDTKNLILS